MSHEQFRQITTTLPIENQVRIIAILSKSADKLSSTIWKDVDVTNFQAQWIFWLKSRLTYWFFSDAWSEHLSKQVLFGAWLTYSAPKASPL